MPIASAADRPPAWAYPLNNPDYKPPVDDGKLLRVPDSMAGYTWTQLRDRFIAPVWHPVESWLHTVAAPLVLPTNWQEAVSSILAVLLGVGHELVDSGVR